MNIISCNSSLPPSQPSNASEAFSFRKLCLSDLETIALRWNEVADQISVELLLSTEGDKTLLSHLGSKLNEDYSIKVWLKLKTPPLETLTQGPNSFFLEATKYAPKIAEQIWHAYKKELSPGVLQGQGELSSPAYYMMLHCSSDILDELLHQIPQIFRQCDKTIEALQERGEHGQRCIKRIYARNALFAELDRLANKDDLSQEDIDHAEKLASEATFRGYLNAFWDLGNVVSEKANYEEAALDMFGQVVKASWNSATVSSFLSDAYIDLAKEASGDDKNRLVKKSLVVAKNMPKMHQEQAIQRIASCYLNRSIKDKTIVPRHIFELLQSHPVTDWVLLEFDRMQNIFTLEAETQALEAQNSDLQQEFDRQLSKLQNTVGNK